MVDVNVPTLNGYVLLEEVRQKDKNLPILFITAIAILSPKYRYDKKHKILYYENKEQALSRKHLHIIDLLASNMNFVFNFDSFRSRVWECDDIDDATIRTEINRLRRLLKEELIVNAKGLGYKLEKRQ